MRKLDEFEFYQDFDPTTGLHRITGFNKLMHAVDQKASYQYVISLANTESVNYVTPDGKTLAHVLINGYTHDLTYDHPTNTIHLAGPPFESWVVEMLEKFISLGLDINKTDTNDSTPLMLCDASAVLPYWNRRYGLALFQCLLDNKANVNAVDWKGRTCLHYMAIRGETNLFLYTCLLDAGCDPNKPDNNGDTAITLLANESKIEHLESRHPRLGDICEAKIPLYEVIRLLVGRGANINHQNNNGDTALHLHTRIHGARYACCFIRRLWVLGAKNIPNKKGEYPNTEPSWWDFFSNLFAY